MRTAAITLLLLGAVAVVPARPARAHGHGITIGDSRASCADSPARWAPRHDPRAARLAITNEDGSTTLLLTRDVVAMQLSDRFLHKIDREMRREEGRDEDEGFLAEVIKGAVLGGVREMLNHSLECPIEELRDVEYRHGRLVFTTEDGERIFEDVKIDDRDVTEDFSARDARAFVREFYRLKDRGH